MKQYTGKHVETAYTIAVEEVKRQEAFWKARKASFTQRFGSDFLVFPKKSGPCREHGQPCKMGARQPIAMLFKLAVYGE